MQGGKLIEQYHEEQHYRVVFDQRKGFFVRKEDIGYPEPLWSADGPELIDLSITNYCERNCDFCYRETCVEKAKFINLEEVEKIVSQAESCGTLQIAIGGGNPNQHPEFTDILKIIRNHNIVPSYTSNGDGLSNKILTATSDYCGAMAISFYPPYDEEHYEQILQRIWNYKIPVNLHVIIREDVLDLWIKWIKTPPKFFRYINAIVFLNYKPIRNVHSEKNTKKIQLLFETIDQCRDVKIGFDSCSISGIVKWLSIPSYLIESCEAARFSAFISEDMNMYPCSFMINQGYYGDLRKESMVDIWQRNAYFKRIRENNPSNRCINCKYVSICKGGCPLFPDINFC